MKVRDMALCALFAALLSLCAWICVPIGDIAFTMQTFGVFLTLGLLGGKRGTLAILTYLLLGAIGLPVFSGFQGGIGTLLGVTGGYILGFLVSGLIYWLLTGTFGQRLRLLAMLAGLMTCYGFGSVWFYMLYLQNGSTVSIALILSKCVLPFLLPDILKLALAYGLTCRLKRFLVS